MPDILKKTAIYLLCLPLFYGAWLGSDVFFNSNLEPYILVSTFVYWSIYKPSLFHPVFILILGFLCDLFLNGMIGFHSLILIAIYFVLKSQRTFFLGQTYLALFVVLIFTLSFYALAHWFFLSLSYHHFLPYEYFFHNVVMSILLFPFLSLFFLGLRRLFSLTLESHHA